MAKKAEISSDADKKKPFFRSIVCASLNKGIVIFKFYNIGDLKLIKNVVPSWLVLILMLALCLWAI